MTVSALRSLERVFVGNDGRISEEEAAALVGSTADYGAVSTEEKAELRALVSRNRDRLDAAAGVTLERFLATGEAPPPAPAPVPDVVRSVEGRNPATFSDDTVLLGPDGTVKGESGVVPYTRSYDSTKTGPLRFKHGSTAPDSNAVSPDALAKVREQSPGTALDAAAAVYGARVDGFEKMANSKNFFDDQAEFWWGKCHAWTWSSLSKRIDQLVDVDGPEGQRGLWVGGQWLSRADLGNWMMAVADEISIAGPSQLFKENLSAADLVKGTTQFMMNNGGGVIGDVYNDQKHGGERQVWNQPFVSSELTTRTVAGSAARAVLDLAKADGAAGGAAVKRVTIVGRYGVEASDDHEGPSTQSSKTWNLYAVADANGKMLTAYMADDVKLKRVAGLPARTTDELPDYLWKPKLTAIDDVLAGRRNWNVELGAHGPEFKFFLTTVLGKGVPGNARAAFEAELAATPAGAVDSGRATDLARKYPGIANAYTPTQWGAAFGARGLEPRAFGAAW